MKVLKFGGTSVSSAENIVKVKDIIFEKFAEDNLAVVVSALGGVTDMLLQSGKDASEGKPEYQQLLEDIEKRHVEICKALLSVTIQSKTLSRLKILLNDLEDICKGVFLIRELSLKTQDSILSFGERLSSIIITDYLMGQGEQVILAEPKDLIVTDAQFGSANVIFSTTDKKIKEFFKERSGITVCAGFVAYTERGAITTLGRGGSDYTAAIIAAALEASALEIWTDVSGMMTADPRLVPSAHAIESMSYEEAMELSHFGAKVIYPPTIQPVLELGIPVLVKNTFTPEDKGTLISDKPVGNGKLIKGLSSINGIALLNLAGSGMVGIPNFSNRLFRALSTKDINVILITQASSEHSICIGIDEHDATMAKVAVDEEFAYEISIHKVDPLEIEKELSIIALVGSNMRDQVGVSGKMFSTLGHNGVSIKAIAQGSSERNISVVIAQKDARKALNSLHESFFLSERKLVNIFVIGVGNVGGALIGQLRAQMDYLLTHHHIEVRIVGIANSRKMYFDVAGVPLDSWKALLDEKGKTMEKTGFVEQMEAFNLRNSVFVDNTDSYDIAELYKRILTSSISVVTPNKVACSSAYDNYLDLKWTARRYGAQFLYETNVGAGLPVISTLSDLIKSGDRVNKIQAVLSGSLNFIFNNFSNTTNFSDIVKQAKEEGYTEPDPRIDLSGVDVMRKILILIRDSGVKMDLEDITSNPFIPEDCMESEDTEAFLEKLKSHESYFQEMLSEAASKGKKLKYVATYDNGKAEAGLQQVDDTHPFYHLEGKDNIVLFYTDRYVDQPLVVKGAGAGAEVTASGIFADIMRIALN